MIQDFCPKNFLDKNLKNTIAIASLEEKNIILNVNRFTQLLL